MITLFVDSSRKNLSVVLYKDNDIVFISNVESYSKHSNYLLNEIKKILNKFSLTVNDVDNYIVLNGPGSFTGVRVGVTVCKTLAWVLGKKLYVLNNLKALKIGTTNEVVIAVIPDKKQASYVGIYTEKSIKEDYLYLNAELFNMSDKNITIVSMVENEYLSSLKERLSINNKVLVKMVDDYNYKDIINYVLSNRSINPHLAEPIYLKKIDAEKK